MVSSVHSESQTTAALTGLHHCVIVHLAAPRSLPQLGESTLHGDSRHQPARTACDPPHSTLRAHSRHQPARTACDPLLSRARPTDVKCLRCNQTPYPASVIFSLNTGTAHGALCWFRGRHVTLARAFARAGSRPSAAGTPR